MRTGLLVEKLGMSSFFTEDGVKVPVTLMKMDKTQVIGQKTVEKDGYNAVVLGYADIALRKVSKPIREAFNKKNLEVKKIQKEFRVSDDNLLEVGSDLTISHFQAGQFVDATSVSIGKGFAGAMKRWNFGGLRASHGVSITHRSHGSTGSNQDPGRVFKNKKMAGQLGNKRVTIQNLQVIDIDVEKNIIIVKGNVPGPKNSVIYLRDSIKK